MSQKGLGEKLRELRESKGLTREQLYSQTKILVVYIEALENGRWDLLPGKAYLKPFVKNITGALGADYQEFYEFIESHEKKKTEPESEGSTKKFDYRWLALILMVALVALIVYLLKPVKQDESMEQVDDDVIAIVESDNSHDVLDREYSSDLDISGKMFEGKTLHRVELTAIDSVWIMLTSADDTLYAGLLTEGRQIVRESLEPFVLFMGKSNSMNVKYNGVDLPRDGILLNRRRIDFETLDLEPKPQNGGSVEGF